MFCDSPAQSAVEDYKVRRGHDPVGGPGAEEGEPGVGWRFKGHFWILGNSLGNFWAIFVFGHFLWY